MAHPKRRQSSTRRDKRRTHYKATVAQIATCPVTKAQLISCNRCGYTNNPHKSPTFK